MILLVEKVEAEDSIKGGVSSVSFDTEAPERCSDEYYMRDCAGYRSAPIHILVFTISVRKKPLLEKVS